MTFAAALKTRWSLLVVEPDVPASRQLQESTRDVTKYTMVYYEGNCYLMVELPFTRVYCGIL